MLPAKPETISALLLDIEGTTSSVSFVFDVMFPFVRRELKPFLAQHWHTPNLQATCELIAQDAGATSFAQWCAKNLASPDMASHTEAQQALVIEEVLRLMDADVKATGLKQLQGLIWESGFDSGELQAHVYEDVPPALKRWNAAGKDVRIYSSGSIQAQKLFFGHTIQGNLLANFRGHYDTTIGSKRESASYVRIAAAMQYPAETILFVSDIVAELDAARSAGMQTRLAMRPGNAIQPAGHTHAAIHSFAEIE
jgi:enolase-phosphatase E1